MKKPETVIAIGEEISEMLTKLESNTGVVINHLELCGAAITTRPGDPRPRFELSVAMDIKRPKRRAGTRRAR